MRTNAPYVDPRTIDVDPAFGRRVRQLRFQAGVNQRDIAEKAGIDFTYLSKIEKAKILPPARETILRLAQALETDADELLRLAGKVAPDVENALIDNPALWDVVRGMAHLDPNVLKGLAAAWPRPAKKE